MTKVNVTHQVPSHVQANYPAFVNFVQAYYDWLHNDYLPNSVESLINLDETPDEFVKYFKRQLAKDIPENIQLSPQLLYQHIKDLYRAKGTEAGYKLLFRLLYGQEIDIAYPSQQILRASDGRWQQDFSIFVRVDYGNIEEILEKTIKIQSSNTINVYVSRYTLVDDGIYEVFIDRQYSGSIRINDFIVTPTFRATILPTISSVKVISGGKNFKIGEILTLTSPSGTPFVIKVSEIFSDGSIKRVQIIKFGYGYISSFVNYALSSSNSTASANAPFTESSETGANILEYYHDIGERGYVNRHTYLETGGPDAPAWDSTYVGNIVSEFIYDNNQSGIAQSLFAKIGVELGAVAKYPGYYKTNDGFLNDLIYIQDSYYYQDFSYMIRANQQLDVYKDALKSLLHPAGLALFGEFDIFNEFIFDVTNQSSGNT